MKVTRARWWVEERCAYGFVGLGVMASLLLVAGSAEAQLDPNAARERISAFPCLICPAGGEVLGILPGGRGRAVRRFAAFREFCVSDYRYSDGELHVRFKLDDELWPAEEDWALQADSWQAVCRTMRWQTR